MGSLECLDGSDERGNKKPGYPTMHPVGDSAVIAFTEYIINAGIYYRVA
jgi:hypothetical protein